MCNSRLNLDFSTLVWSLLPLEINVSSVIFPFQRILIVSFINGTLSIVLGIRLVSQIIVERISCMGTWMLLNDRLTLN